MAKYNNIARTTTTTIRVKQWNDTYNEHAFKYAKGERANDERRAWLWRMGRMSDGGTLTRVHGAYAQRQLQSGSSAM